MTDQKPKKAFLKKNARPFLSNAQVRSLNQKPRIVQFQSEDIQNFNTGFNHHTSNNKKQEINISVKPKNQSKQKIVSASQSAKITKKKANNSISNEKLSQRQNLRQNFAKRSSQQDVIKVSEKRQQPTRVSTSKSIHKKPTMLSDYLNNDQKASKKSAPQAIIPKQTIIQSKVQQLKRQDQYQNDSEVQNQQNQNQFIVQTKNNFISKQIKQEPSKKKPNLLQEAFGKKEKQNLTNNYEQKRQEQSFKIQSDQQQQDKSKKNHFKGKSQINKYKQQHQQHQQVSDDQDIQTKATVKVVNKPHSKVTQMFNKTSDKKITNQTEQIIPINKVKKLTAQDIPKQLVEQIVERYFKDAKSKYQKKQANLFEQVKIVQKKSQSLAQSQKQLQKRMKQFDKQMQQRTKQVTQKLKSQQNKISRQKMYLKDQQTSNKVDWKTKNQIQQLKQLLQQQKTQRKKVQVKLKSELDRLKIKYNQEQQSKRLLENRIKQYQLRELKQTQNKKKEEKREKQENIMKKKSFWDDSPKQSFLARFYQRDFSLKQFQMQDFLYENNQFYQYFKQKGETDILQCQQIQSGKIKRTYQNGKIQIEAPKKFLKQVFPWGFTIVHYTNGDIKQVISLPNQSQPQCPIRLQIYYAKNNQIIEYSLSQTKRIHYFLGQDQLELNDQMVDLKEVYNGMQLQRNQKGRTIVMRKNGKGKFVEEF